MADTSYFRCPIGCHECAVSVGLILTSTHFVKLWVGGTSCSGGTVTTQEQFSQ